MGGSDARASRGTADGRFMTIVAGGQQAPRKCCLSSSTRRVRGSRAFGSRSVFQPDHHASTNLKNQCDIRSEIAIHGEMRSHAGVGPELDSWYGRVEGLLPAATRRSA